MYTIKDVNIFSDHIEGQAIAQMVTAMEPDWAIKGALMPDAHLGYGLPIGGVLAAQDHIVPSFVGYDIGCFTADTEIALADGREITFAQLIDEHNRGIEHYVYSKSVEGHISIEKIHMPRQTRVVDQLVIITLDNGEQIKCTPDHIFYGLDNSEIEAIDLSEGQSLFPFYRYEAQDIEANEMYNDVQRLKGYHVIWDPGHGKFVYAHYLASTMSVDKGYQRHHIDFNKQNNNPTNLEILTLAEHNKKHVDSGWSKKRGQELGAMPNSAKNRKAASINMKKLHTDPEFRAKVLANSTKNMYSDKQAVVANWKKAGSRGKRYLCNKNANYQIRQQVGKVRKILLCIDGEINENTYNAARKKLNWKNAPTWDYACNLSNKLSISLSAMIDYDKVKDILDKNYPINHKVVSVELCDAPNTPVYCLTVNNTHNFALSSGVFVHNCGMCAAKLNYTKDDVVSCASDIYNAICVDIPLGFNIHTSNKSVSQVLGRDILSSVSKVTSGILNSSKAANSLGTLGGGNHFIEIGYDADNMIWLIIHSGSRGPGHAVATHYMKIAGGGKAREGVWPLSVESEVGQEYSNDLACMLEYALANRRIMMETIINLMEDIVDKESITLEFINRNHNHAEYKDGLWIHRKGATHAEKGMMGVIPGNMRDGSFIVRGKGNPNSLYSSSHGAGRVLGRNAAKNTLDVSVFKDAMKYVVCHADKSTLDESPMAYKDIFQVMEDQKDLVDVITHVKPILNVKG